MNDLSHKKELADEARSLLDNRAFTQAILELRKRWFDQLMAVRTNEERLDLVAALKALEAIPTELQIQINNYTMAKRNG